MGFVFRGYDENNTPRYDYIPDMTVEKETEKLPHSEPEGITPVPKSSPPHKPSPPIMKQVGDASCPNPLLFFCAGCAVGAVVVLILNQ